MDDYLFITLAKLKSDRLSLERRRGAQTDAEQLRLDLAEPVETPRAPARQSLLARWFSHQPLWREQT